MPVTKDDGACSVGVRSPRQTVRRCRKPVRCRRSLPATAKCSSRSPSTPPSCNPGSRCEKRAEDAVKAIPGVQSAMVALTGERKGGAAPPARPAQGWGSRWPHARTMARRQGPSGRAWSWFDHRGGFGEGRRRQIDHRDQSRARAPRFGYEGGRPRRGHLRALRCRNFWPSKRNRRPSTVSG